MSLLLKLSSTYLVCNSGVCDFFLLICLNSLCAIIIFMLVELVRLREVLAKLEGAGNKAEGERREWSPSHSVVEGAKEPLSHAVDRGAQRKLRQQQKKLKEEEAKLRPLRKEFHLKHGFPLGADEGEEHQVPNPGRSPNQRLITSLRRRSSMMQGSQPCSVFC